MRFYFRNWSWKKIYPKLGRVVSLLKWLLSSLARTWLNKRSQEDQSSASKAPLALASSAEMLRKKEEDGINPHSSLFLSEDSWRESFSLAKQANFFFWEFINCVSPQNHWASSAAAAAPSPPHRKRERVTEAKFKFSLHTHADRVGRTTTVRNSFHAQ